jgi:hypothetical protein
MACRKSGPRATQRFCAYCFARLPRGDNDFCDDDCEDGQWAIVPTIDGEIFEPEPGPLPYVDQRDQKLVRPVLELPPQPHEAAPLGDREFIAAMRLRRHLVECGL